MRIRYEDGKLVEISFCCRVQNHNTLNDMLELDLTLVEPSGAYSTLSSHSQYIRLTRQTLLQSKIPSDIFELQDALIKITVTRTSEELATVRLQQIVTKEEVLTQQRDFITTRILKLQSNDSLGGSVTVVRGDAIKFELPVEEIVLQRIKESEAFHFTVAISLAAV
jgi:hypothetical protein